MSNNIYKKVLTYLKSNPGAGPREIADSLGISINTVRYVLLRLRESGYVVKTSKGGYVFREKPSTEGLEDFNYNEDQTKIAEVRDIEREAKDEVKEDLSELVKALAADFEKLKKEVEDLTARITKLENAFNLMIKSLTADKKDRYVGLERDVKHVMKPILKVVEARNLGLPVEALVRSGEYILVRDLLVSSEFMNEFKRKFPLKVSDVELLDDEEKELLEALIREGLVYLHASKEYRIT